MVPPAYAPETLAVDDVIRAVVWPKGCFSSSCSQVLKSGCTLAAAGNNVSVSADFCIADLSSSGQACTADCSGGGVATCTGAGKWTAGTHTVTLGDLAVTVTIPATVPLGGACTGSQF